MYKCQHCPKSYTSKARLNLHVAYIHLKVRFKCKKCPNEYKTKWNLEIHMTKFHNTGKTILCKTCGNEFVTKSGLKIHRKKGCKIPTCPHCGLTFKNCKLKRQHIRQTHEKSCAKRCGQCGLYFYGKEGLENHAMTDCCTTSCNICLQTFDSPEGLAIHKAKPHKQKGSLQKGPLNVETLEDCDKNLLQTVFKCGSCSEVYGTHYAITKHLIKFQGNCKGAKVCKICKKPFAKLYALITHMEEVHEKDKHVPCPKCGKKFTPRYLQHHNNICVNPNYKLEVREGLKTFKCNLCNRSITHRARIFEHVVNCHRSLMLGINNMDKDQVKTCNVCQKEIPNSQFGSHIHEHLIRRLMKQQCNKCESCYGNDYSLQIHKTTHWNEEDFKNKQVPWACKFCGNPILQREKLLKHLKSCGKTIG